MRLLSSHHRAAGRRALRSVSAAAVLVAAAAVPAGAAAKSAIAGSVRFKGAPRSSSNGNLVDNGGRITSASKTYAIFWGSTSAWASDVPSGIGSLFSGFGSYNSSPVSNYLGIAQQYMRGATISSTYGGAKFDPSAPPKRVSASTLGNEVLKEYGTPDQNGIYFVYTSNFPNGGGYCAWHSFTSVNGQNTAVAYMPNTTGVAGCDPGNPYSLSGSEGLRSLANVSAHEFMEAVTDTWPGTGNYAWIDQSGSEIGDKCAWQFTGPVSLSNNSVWQLQEEWSNAAFGCVQGS